MRGRKEGSWIFRVKSMSEHGSVYQCTHTNSVIIKTSKSEGISVVDMLIQENNER